MMSGVYTLTSENLTGLGGPMGTERTWTNFTKNFSSVSKAKKYANKDYGNKIAWKINSKTHKRTSGDLGFVMYTIEEIIIES